MERKAREEIKAEIKAALKSRTKKLNLPNAVKDPSDGFREILDRFDSVPADIFMEAFQEHFNERRVPE